MEYIRVRDRFLYKILKFNNYFFIASLFDAEKWALPRLIASHNHSVPSQNVPKGKNLEMSHQKI
jgi:hypothetical protein